jgi:hypothetical protein
MNRRTLAVVVTALVLTSAGTARAQAAQDKAAAEVLFEEGKELMHQKKFGLACPKFLESNRLDAGLGTILWLADCYEKNGQTASAWGQFREAAEIAARQHDPREKVAHARAVRLERTLAKMTIIVGAGTAVPGLEVTRDGDKIGQPSWGEEVPVDPGPHKIAVTAPHKKPWESIVNVSPGARNIDVPVPPLEDAPEPIAPPPPPLVATQTPDVEGEHPPPRSGGGAQKVVGGSVLALGIIGVGLGTYFGIRALLDNNESKAPSSSTTTSSPPPNCDASNHCNSMGTELRNDALSAAKGSTIAFVVGGVLTAGGLVVILTAPSATGSKHVVGMTPWLNRNGGGVGMTGAW